MALVSAHTIPTLLDLMAAGKLDASAMITHGKFEWRWSDGVVLTRPHRLQVLAD